MTTSTPTTQPARPPFYRDIRVIRVVGQVVAVVLVFLILRYFYGNLVDNFRRIGVALNFEFLQTETNFRVPYDNQFNPRSPVWEMTLVGVKNTFLAGFFGIIIASIVGLFVGISRLSDNWLVARLGTAYVEFFRNIPPLVIIVFFGFAVFFYGPFPIFSESNELSVGGNNLLILNGDRIGVPGITQTGDALLFWVVLLIGIAAAVYAWRWRTRVFDQTGQDHHRVLWSLGIILLALIVGFFIAGQPFEMSYPAISEDRRLYVGGFAINWGFLSVTIALGLYTASHIGEIIRGSILAVHSGQSEAANALALNAFQRYRFVILPQALRIALPPTINQFLNLVKNTSLATAVGYADVTALTKSSIGNGRPTFQSVVIMMAVYLTFSLTISVILNQVNRRMQLVER